MLFCWRMKMNFKDSIQFIKGVGEKRAKLFAKLGVFTVEDLLYFFPRDYDDRSQLKTIARCEAGEKNTFSATVIEVSKDLIFKNKTLTKVKLGDSSGNITAIWYNQPYIKQTMICGSRFIFTGKIEKKMNHLEIISPEYEKLGDADCLNGGRIVPIYPTTHNLSQKIIRSIINEVLYSVKEDLKEFIPRYIREEYNLVDLSYAMQNIHFPESKKAFFDARNRFIFEELLILQLGLFKLKNNLQQEGKGIQCSPVNSLNSFVNALPFGLTDAQKRVLNDVLTDMESNKITNRLIQGDVGSGKTVIAALALFESVKNGYQGALMAPTEVLARQHFESLSVLFKDEKIKVDVLVGSLTKKQKNLVYQKLKNHEIDIIIGTHALIQEQVEFSNLGLVITDEQHRFGVRQRGILSNKGCNPDVLVMTATPIPRTLAAILYGDLDISIIDEMPPGRQKIDTYVVDESYRERINKFIIEQVTAGRQVYIICPMVEENEELNLKSVIEYTENIKEKYFPHLTVAYLHGKMKPHEKNAIMEAFSKNELQILVSTTVIEVGVNVPNATLMIIENAERFGLAQLHQLRGRVGRGEHKSFCILFTESKSKISREKMQVMKKTNDGFIISEKDLELRGPGEFFGVRQHGLPELRIANLFKDIEVLKKVQELCKSIIDKKLLEECKEYSLLKQRIFENFEHKVNELPFY